MHVLSNGKKAILVENPDFEGDWKERYFPGADYAEADLIEGTVPESGIMYSTDLAGRNGVNVTLFPESKHDEWDVATAKGWIRNERDVVSIRIVRLQ